MICKHVLFDDAGKYVLIGMFIILVLHPIHIVRVQQYKVTQYSLKEVFVLDHMALCFQASCSCLVVSYRSVASSDMTNLPR